MSTLRAGDNAHESDFINASERDLSTPANDFDHVPRLEDVGGKAKVSAKLLADSEADVVLGETIDGSTTPKAVFIADGGTESSETNQNSGVDYGSGYRLDTAKQLSQAFTNTHLDYITKIKWKSSISGIGSDDNLYIELFAVDGSNLPTGSALASKTYNDDSFYYNDHICEFDSPVAVSRDTNYALVMRVSTTNGGDEYLFYRTLENNTSFPKELQYRVNGAGSWADADGYPDEFYIEGYEDLEVGKVYKSDKNFAQRENFNGFVYESGDADDVKGMRNDKSAGFSSLTSGAKYYIDEDGDISTTVAGVLVGTAFGDEEIQIGSTREIGDLTSLGGTSDVEHIAPSSGFWFGRYWDNTSSSTSMDVDMVMNGTSLSFTVPENTGFCFPCNKGDSITLDHSYSAQLYFRPIF